MWVCWLSLYRRETLNNLSFLHHGDPDAVPTCVMATVKHADGTEVMLLCISLCLC